MASPFMNYLRKHQGYVLAVLGVILIVTWVLGPALLEFLNTGGRVMDNGRLNRVVARWKKGEVTQGQLDRMRYERMAVVGFLSAVVREARERGAEPQAPGLDIDRGSLGIPTGTDRDSLVETMLLAERGRELGVKVDDQALQRYLTNLGGLILNDVEIQTLAHQALENFRHLISISQLYDRLKVELVARQSQIMLQSGVTSFSTADLWEYHSQLHRRCKIEAYPLDMATYRDQVNEKDAPEEELKKIYQEGKDREPHPMFPDPGFRKPLRLAFGYLRADLQPFLEVAKKDITEEQIVAEYEQGIREGRFNKPAISPPPTTPPVKEEDKKEPMAPGDTPPAEKTDKPAADEKAKPENEKTPPASTEDKANSEPPAPKDEAVKEKPEGACQDETARQEEPVSDKEKEKEPKGKEPAAAEKSKEAPATDSKTADDQPEKTGDKPAEGTTPSGDAAEKPKQEVLPLSAVRDEIIARLAAPEAIKARDAAVKSALKEVREYGIKHESWVRSKKDPTRTPAKDPGELKVQSIAKRNNLTAGKTGLMDPFQAEKNLDLGQAMGVGPQGSIPFVADAYQDPSVPLYSPKELGSLLRDTSYIYWRTELEPAAEVPYEKARPKVLEVWRNRKALELAKKAAEELADKAGKAGSLKAALPEEEAKTVTEPPEFSWLSRDATPIMFGGAPRLSEVVEIPMAGEEFMKSVFSLEVGQAGVAVNQPETQVYVVRVLSDAPSLDIRREMFLSSLQQGIFGDLVQYARLQQRRMVLRVFDDLQKEYKLELVALPTEAEEMEDM